MKGKSTPLVVGFIVSTAVTIIGYFISLVPNINFFAGSSRLILFFIMLTVNVIIISVTYSKIFEHDILLEVSRRKLELDRKEQILINEAQIQNLQTTIHKFKSAVEHIKLQRELIAELYTQLEAYNNKLTKNNSELETYVARLRALSGREECTDEDI